MVNTPYMYKTYKQVIRSKMTMFRKQIKLTNDTKSKFKDILLSHGKIIAANTSANLRDLRSDAFYTSTFDFIIKPSSSDLYIELIPSLRGSFDIIQKCIKKIDALNNSIDVLKRQLIDYTTFKLIITNYNEGIIEQVSKGETYKFTNKIGTIYIKRKDRFYTSDPNSKYRSNDKNIDWGKSFKQKQYLIDKGLTPLEYIKDDEGNITGDNGGVEWIMINEDDHTYWWMWNNHLCIVPNYSYYVFKPSGYNNEEYTTDEMKEMSFGDELFSMKLGAATKANIYRHINPDVKLKYIQ